MVKSIEAVGKTEEEAISSALSQLGKERDEVSVEIIERSRSGFLGIGSSPAKVRVSYEYKESTVELTEKFLIGLLKKMGSDAVPKVEMAENDRINVDLIGEKLGILIGRRGETLDAIQHITNSVVNRGGDSRVHISIDAESYRSKREDSLQRLAEKVAGKVLKYRKNMTLEPMNSYERHVIHTALQEYEGVTTFSTGVEPNRRIVVAYGKNRRIVEEKSRKKT
ncbi:MAG: protein jag [Clostridiales bacterium]|jgi:spoIIIJ-associated protein|nr:protein jag [Clostridiales bacterium]